VLQKASGKNWRDVMVCIWAVCTPVKLSFGGVEEPQKDLKLSRNILRIGSGEGDG
jgi:hypothetical protein